MSGKSVRRARLYRLRRLAGLCWMMFAVAPPAFAVTDRTQLAELPIEQLLSLEVYSASKFTQKASDAPSAVSVVTAADIKAFGWRTVADILRSMRGLYVSNDRNYSYLGARGFLRPGDYNTRFLLLVDGYRTNDAVFDQASIGSEALLDVDLIERVEYVPGPGSSIYGSNAFFGVINIITRHARDMAGAQVSGEAGSWGSRKVRASYGWHADDREFLLSATSWQVDGQDLYYPEFDTPATSNGIARHLDYDRYHNVFAKGAAGPFSLSFAYNERTKGIPTASFQQVFNDPRSRTVDAQSFISLGYRTPLSGETELATRLFWGHYNYDGDYVYNYPPLTVNRDGARAAWWGGEAKLVSTRFERHKFVVGMEYERDYRRNQFNYDIDPYSLKLDDRRSGNREGVYLQDEITLRDSLLFNAGLRYDHHSASGGVANPRFGLIWKAASATTIKALYGRAYRAPNAYELYYALPGPGGQKSNPDLRPERIRTQELIAEHFLTPDMRVTASLFRNQVSDLISQTTDPTDGLLLFRNINQATATGIELELEKTWSGGARLRTSASLQRARDDSTGAALVNSPRQLAKFNWTAPLPAATWRAGVEAQYVGRRQTLQGEVAGYWLANVTLSSVRLAPGLEASAGIYNLFDRRYADPGGEEHVQDAIPQDGRNFRVKLSYSF